MTRWKQARGFIFACLWCLMVLAGTPIQSIQAAGQRIPIILDTDIGTDVDDAYALVLCARSPQLDLRGVVTLYGNVEIRSALARKLLLLMGREDVPVASGPAKPYDGRQMGWGGWEGKGVLADGETVPGISAKPAHELMNDILTKSKEKVVIASVGGLTNVAELLKHHPAAKDKIERLVIMGGCLKPITIRDQTIPSRYETNFHNDPEAAAQVLQSGVPMTIAPAEMTFRTKLLRSDFERIQRGQTPFAKGMAAMTSTWAAVMKKFFEQFNVTDYHADSVAMMHDPSAIFSLTHPAAVKRETIQFRVETGKGTIRTIIDPNGPVSAEVITEVDIPALSRTLTELVLK